FPLRDPGRFAMRAVATRAGTRKPTPRQRPGGILALVLGILGMVASTAPVAGQARLPYGFSATSQTKYSRARSFRNEIFENWVDLDYSRADVTAGLRFVAFQPPDPSVFQGQASKGVDLYYAEYDAQRIKARAGTFYAQFGRGLALRLYEDRSLRLDHNA